MKRVIALHGRSESNSRKSHENIYPWMKGELVVFLGELEDMPGHGIYVRNDGKTYYGYHTSDFIPLVDHSDSDYDSLASEMESRRDPLDNRLYHCLSEKYIKEKEKLEKDTIGYGQKYERFLNLDQTLQQMLKAPQMWARSPEGLEDAFMILVSTIDSVFVHQEIPVIKNSKCKLGNSPFAPTYNFTSTPSITDVLTEVYIKLKEYIEK